MKADQKTIWTVPRYLPYIQPDLTDEAVKATESLIGYKLPKEYLELLKIQNGGYIRFTLPDTIHSMIYGIGPHYPSINEFDRLEDYEEDVSFDLKGLIPFDGDGHWFICFDYRKNKQEPEISFVDTEMDEEGSIAKNFREYLDLLEYEADESYFIETDLSIEDVVNRISTAAKIKFEEPDSSAHGYPTYRSKYKDSWVWISPNKVPAGFIRKGENRYEELKSLMDVSSVRFPELSERSLLINGSDEPHRLELFDLLEKSGIRIRLLKEVL